MIHNGTEYGDMQLIAEAYDIMRFGLGLSPDQIAELCSYCQPPELLYWNRGFQSRKVCVYFNKTVRL